MSMYLRMNDMYPGDQEKLGFARKVLQRKARDHARTPMQWTSQSNAGFCKETTAPWMRVNDDYMTVNVEAQRIHKAQEDFSVLQFWKEALAIRKSDKSSFVYGDYHLLTNDKGPIFAYKRTSESDTWIVALNFSGQTVSWDLPDTLKVEEWKLGNYDTKPKQPKTSPVELRPWEGVLGKAASM